ncbi:MAG: ATP-binding protein [Nitrososphaeraceae archaeon]|jgi:two-component system, OmpR family, sensor histidine kinase VicK
METTPSTRSTEMTEVLSGEEHVMSTMLKFLSKAHKIDSCGDYKAPSLILEVRQYKKLLSDIKAKGIQLRYITDITKDNIHYCKELLKFAKEVRHLAGMRANFSVSETEYMASASIQQQEENQQQQQQQEQPIPQVIYSNAKDLVEQQKYVFESLWNKATPSDQRFREIEEGIDAEVFEVFNNGEKVGQIVLDLARSAEKEMLIHLPNDKSMVRLERLGVIDEIIQASRKGVVVKILCPLSKENTHIVKKIYDNSTTTEILNGNKSPYGMYIVDGERFLRAEVKELQAENFSEAIGRAVYSNSKRSVESFKSIFELFWNERTLNEELKRADKMQKEFINIASHELRTPTQAILSYSELLQKHPERKEEMIQALSRNAGRLQRLTDDILDVTRIESETLMLKIEPLNIGDLISSIVEDYRNQIEKNNDNVELYHYKPENNDDSIIVEADRARLIQVISNLLDNAVKFTNKQYNKRGSIYVNVEKKNKNGNKKQEVIVAIKDNGTGIDPEIMPRLFTRFATKSETGTGLGLFISKSIIEVHSGRIWAENNTDGDGATFTFSLPIGQQQHQQGQEPRPSSSNLTSEKRRM